MGRALDVLNSGLCGEDEDDLLYHALPSRLIQTVLAEGLRPGRGETFGTQGWSGGKVFLAAGWGKAIMWQGFIEEQLGESVGILAVQLPDRWLRQLNVDTVAAEEGDPCAFFLTRTVPARFLSVEDYGYG